MQTWLRARKGRDTLLQQAWGRQGVRDLLQRVHLCDFLEHRATIQVLGDLRAHSAKVSLCSQPAQSLSSATSRAR